MFIDSWTDDLADTNPDPDWVWRGLLAPGQITLLTGLWKAGKTTLLGHLLARRHQGGALLGQAVHPGPTIVVSEESRALWRARIRNLPPGPDACFICRPFFGRPSRAEFDELIAHLLELRRHRGADLVALDPLASFLSARTENVAEEMIAALAPLRRLTDAGFAVLLPHHPAKGNPNPGQAARGSGALLAYVDIHLELRLADPMNPADRRRLLFAYGRSDETPPLVHFELNADGKDYTVLPDQPGGDFPRHWPVLLGVLEDAADKLTRLQILGEWPADFPRPSLASLWRWLDTACARKLVAREGSGRAADPFRYWLPAREHVWLRNVLYRLLHQLPPLETTEPGA
jgi:hypothetical protein